MMELISGASWNDGMQKLEIIWKKVEKVQAEAIASKFEINGKDKKMAAWKGKIWFIFLFLPG